MRYLKTFESIPINQGVDPISQEDVWEIKDAFDDIVDEMDLTKTDFPDTIIDRVYHISGESRYVYDRNVPVSIPDDWKVKINLCSLIIKINVRSWERLRITRDELYELNHIQNFISRIKGLGYLIKFTPYTQGLCMTITKP